MICQKLRKGEKGKICKNIQSLHQVCKYAIIRYNKFNDRFFKNFKKGKKGKYSRPSKALNKSVNMQLNDIISSIIDLSKTSKMEKKGKYSRPSKALDKSVNMQWKEEIINNYNIVFAVQ